MPHPTRYVALALLLAAALLNHAALEQHARTALFICQVFPQSSIKPLDLLGTEPLHELVEFESPNGPITADLFVPTERFGSVAKHSRAGLILAMGVKTAPRDRPLLLELERTFARLGYVVLWPRLQALDHGVSLPEEPQTFVAAVEHLREVEAVDPTRISLLGFSTGASMSLLAASSPEIAHQVRAEVFFGGYFDLSEYLLSLATATVTQDGHSSDWEPSGEAVGHIREILANKHLTGIGRAFDVPRSEATQAFVAAPAAELAELRHLDPASQPLGFDGHLFILHDTGDPLVPSAQSAELYRAMAGRTPTTYVETSLFDHVQPRRDLSWDSLANLVRLIGFVDAALGYL
jgi:predicted esterase